MEKNKAVGSESSRPEGQSRKGNNVGVYIMGAGIVLVVVLLGVIGYYVYEKYVKENLDQDQEQNQKQEECVGEGEEGGEYLAGEECCQGLQRIDNAFWTGDGCAIPTDGSFVCSKCGDGECGPGENECNCELDCGKPEEPVPDRDKLVPVSFVLHEELGNKDYHFTTKIYEYMEFHEYEGHVTVDGGESRFSLTITVPPESYSTKFSQVTFLYDHPEFGRVYRVETLDDPNSYFYSTDVTESGSCNIFGDIVSAPCGTTTIHKSDNSGIFFRAVCLTDSVDFAFCEEVIEHMSLSDV